MTAEGIEAGWIRDMETAMNGGEGRGTRVGRDEAMKVRQMMDIWR